MAHADPRALLQSSPTVAVVGCSSSPHKAAHRIPAMLQRRGFTVIPVNPNAAEILGRPSYPVLEDVPGDIDLVVVFRPSDEAADVTRDAVAVGARGVWLQQGITSTEAQRIAEDAGVPFVQDRCSGVDADRFDIRHATAA